MNSRPYPDPKTIHKKTGNSTIAGLGFYQESKFGYFSFFFTATSVNPSITSLISISL